MNPLMNPQADKILKEMQNTLDKWKNNSQVAMTLLTEQMAQLLVVISEEQERSSVRLQRQTRWLISLTWAIVGLTAGLLFFTIVLYKDTHTLIQREKLTNDCSAQKPQANISSEDVISRVKITRLSRVQNHPPLRR